MDNNDKDKQNLLITVSVLIGFIVGYMMGKII